MTFITDSWMTQSRSSPSATPPAARPGSDRQLCATEVTMNAMKPQVKEAEAVELTPEEEAMLDAAMAEADAGEFVSEEVFYAEFPRLRPR
ncbi:MAG: hypothetical protein JWO97_186 [Acidobacteria bacterium]|nr:hypothetical protein [Acidobacteriota bacterium]